MADRAISELIAASQVTPSDLFVLEQSGTAKKLTGQVLENWLLTLADSHGGIKDIAKSSTSGLKDTYKITLSDGTTENFTVTNGKAISSVKETATSGRTRTYTIAFNDNTSQKFTVTDGRSIDSIAQTAVDGLTRTYTISMNDGTSETFTITDGRSVTEIKKKSTNKLTDTYTVSYNDGTSSTFTVKNGRGIQAFEKVSTVGLVDTYRITYNDGTTDEFTVANGAKGDKGDNTYTWIRYASQEPTEESHSFGEVTDNWIGIYCGSSAEAPTDWEQYDWFEIKGEKGETGDPATVLSSSVTYQASSYGNIVPSGSWSTNIPSVSQGRYLWTRTVVTYNTGSPVTSYSVARMGMDGNGSVSAVCNVSPDEEGNVVLTAEDVGALPSAGGEMSGAINMSGHVISGVQTPENEDEAANKGYVDGRVYELADTVAKLHSEVGAIVESARGEVVSISDASDKELKGLRIFGRTIQNGTPTPSAPVIPESVGETVNVTVCGKNLVDMHDAYIANSSNTQCAISENRVRVYTTTAGTHKGARFPGMMLCKGVTYTLSASLSAFVSGAPRVGFRRAKDMASGNKNSFISGTSVYPTDNVKKTVTFTPSEDIEAYLSMLVTDSTSDDGDATFADIQFEVDTSATEYKPYEGNTMTATVSSGLLGVPVASGGNYTDVDGKHWICDEVDFEKGIYIQRVGKKVFDGTESFAETELSFAYNYSQFALKPMIRTYPILSYATGLEINYKGNLIMPRDLFTDFGVTDMTTFKAWVAAQYAAGTPLTVVYQMEEEKTSPLSEEALAQFATLHSKYPNTTVFNNAGAMTEVKYAADTKLYIDKKFSELATAIVNNV